ncbi:MAG: hypothetical protein MMC33_001593 [Icmadophila ericetorum]|nr:hypothetical protein [Icmadophila ericetorum]
MASDSRVHILRTSDGSTTSLSIMDSSHPMPPKLDTINIKCDYVPSEFTYHELFHLRTGGYLATPCEGPPATEIEEALARVKKEARRRPIISKRQRAARAENERTLDAQRLFDRHVISKIFGREGSRRYWARIEKFNRRRERKKAVKDLLKAPWRFGRKFTINASQPASDKIFDVAAFEKFLHEKIKVDGRVGNLGDAVTITNQGDGKIEVVAHIEFSGRYLKYLTKKFLKKQQLRDWLRVVSTSKGVYELRFFNVVNDDADDDDE